MTESTDFNALLEALREGGVAARDPVQAARLEALARRAASQPESVRRWLESRLRPVDAMRPVSAESHAEDLPSAANPPAASPLGDLLAYISEHAHAPLAVSRPPQQAASLEQPLPAVARPPSLARERKAPELKSVAWFQETWSKLSAEQQLTQTLAQAPENAGPMNSQHLVLRSLQRLREIAPEYLQGFMSYVDSLVWLDHAAPAKPAPGRVAAGERESKERPAKRRTTKR